MNDRFDVILDAKTAVLIEYAVSPGHASQMSLSFGGTGEIPSMTSKQKAAFGKLQDAISDFRKAMKETT